MNFIKKSFFLLSFSSMINGQPMKQIDDLCPNLPEVLCVREIIERIASVTKSVNRTLNQMEIEIVGNGIILDTITRHVQHELHIIHHRLPSPSFHKSFFKQNNIDQPFLGHLLIEAHYAMSFYYNSINDQLNLREDLKTQIDIHWKEVQTNLRQKLLCPYRSVLNVYSYTWPAIDNVQRIEFSKRKYRDTSSLVYDVRSLVIVQLLREWMKNINLVLTNLERKFI